MIRRVLAVLLLGLTGCLSLPPPATTDHPTSAGVAAPSFDLARTGEKPGRATLDSVSGSAGTVLVFYRGDW